MFYVLDTSEAGAVVAYLEGSAAGDDLKWLAGVLFDDADRPADLSVTIEEDQEAEDDEATRNPPDFFESLLAPLCSQRFRQAMTSAGVDNLEYYPAKVFDSSGHEIGRCYALNVVGRIACMDEGASVFTTYEGKIARVKSLVLREDAAHGAKIFRLDECPEIVLVSSDVAEAIRGLRGVSVEPAHGWSDEDQF